jgi:hypothetical protein
MTPSSLTINDDPHLQARYHIGTALFGYIDSALLAVAVAHMSERPKPCLTIMLIDNFFNPDDRL